MPSTQPILASKSNLDFNELRWVIQVRRTIDEELEDNNEIPVCIFNTPKALMATDPDSYTPQQVGLGPYHYLRPELYEMERYKLAAARRMQNHLQTLKFQNLVDQLMTELEPKIRACYHKYLDFSGETLAWMMAIDASFLLEFLQIYAVQQGKVLSRISSRMSHLVDLAGRKSAHNAILKDIVMLENQIPLFVLRKVLEFQLSSLELADDMLLAMSLGLCKELSPFKMIDLPKIQVVERAHLLDVLYHMIVLKIDLEPSEIVIEVVDEQKEAKQGQEGSSSSGYSSQVKQLLAQIWKLLSKLNKGPVRLLKKLLVSKPVKLVVKLPWTIISKLPGFSLLKQPIEYLFSSQEKEDVKPEDGTSTTITKPPLVEEITVPSVTELSESGVCFSPTNGDISTISFDAKTFTFHLPTISLDVNTEVILRNLVAYEASNGSGPLVFTRYTELMNGIIDTEADAKLLREKGIIFNRLKSDKDVADMWNGMNKSVRLTKVDFLDKVIEDVNKYYNGRWKVKVGKFMKLYVFGSWQFLTFVATIMLLALMSLQSFCSVYSCPRLFHVTTTTVL